MQIDIEFNSIWQNSFLEDINGTRRQFIATSKSNHENLFRPISEDTILGILSRLIGDIRPLRIAKHSENFYFKDFEQCISFDDRQCYRESNQETVMLINKNRKAYRPAEGTYLGIISSEHRIFFSDEAKKLWSIFHLDIKSLLEFIDSDKINDKMADSRPLTIIDKLEKFSKMDSLNFLKDKKDSLIKDIEKIKAQKKPNQQKINSLNEDLIKLNNENSLIVDKLLTSCSLRLKEIYPNIELSESGGYKVIRLYIAALYIQASRLIDIGYNLDFCLTSDNEIVIDGFPKSSLKFNGVRDFLNRYAGNKKKTSKTPVKIQKSSGTLQIVLDISREKAKELKQMIENAGVSSFYLGKKGLAYVSNIDTREVN